MKTIITLIYVMMLVSVAGAEEQKIISASTERDAKVLGVVSHDGSTNEVKLISEGKVIWETALTYGYPNQVIVNWSPFSTKVAISLRTTKTTSEIHVFDVRDEKKRLNCLISVRQRTSWSQKQ